MPRERIPEHELLRLYAKPEQRTPDHSRCRLRKTMRALLTLACSFWLNAGKHVFRLDPSIFLFSQQDSLGGHGDSAEMAAAITERFADYHQFRFVEPFAKISG